MSARHLSFVETGRSQPEPRAACCTSPSTSTCRCASATRCCSRPATRRSTAQTPLDADEMAPVRDALDKILAGHEPYPGGGRRPAVGPRHRQRVRARRCSPTASTPALLDAAGRTRCGSACIPMGWRRASSTSPSTARTCSSACTARPSALGDPDLRRAARRAAALPRRPRRAAPVTSIPPRMLFVPLRARGRRRASCAFFSTLATFGTALDITLAELAIESFFPADEATTAALSTPLTSSLRVRVICRMRRPSFWSRRRSPRSCCSSRPRSRRSVWPAVGAGLGIVALLSVDESDGPLWPLFLVVAAVGRGPCSWRSRSRRPARSRSSPRSMFAAGSIGYGLLAEDPLTVVIAVGGSFALPLTYPTLERRRAARRPPAPGRDGVVGRSHRRGRAHRRRDHDRAHRRVVLERPQPRRPLARDPRSWCCRSRA